MKHSIEYEMSNNGVLNPVEHQTIRELIATLQSALSTLEFFTINIDNTLIDSYDVESILKINSRLLQKMRSEGDISYLKRPDGLVRYRLADVIKMIERGKIICTEERMEELKLSQHNYLAKRFSEKPKTISAKEARAKHFPAEECVYVQDKYSVGK